MSEEWQFQVSPKLDDGTLVNVRGADAEEFVNNIELLRSSADVVVGAVQALREAGREAGLTATMDRAVATVQEVMPGAEQIADPKYRCKHGPRVLKTSKPGAAKKWTAYFCGGPMGATDKCDTVFVD